jgi:hypothetical protein
MTSPGHWALALFLCLLSFQLGLSMELGWVIWLGPLLSIIGALQLFKVERPTWGLTLVLLGGGGFLGDQVLADWALERSWAQRNSLAAGIILSLLLYLLWLYAARNKQRASAVVERDTQTILVLGMLPLLLGAPPEASLVAVGDHSAALLVGAGLLLATVAMLADRVGPSFLKRLLLLLPMLALTPIITVTLNQAQGPALAALSNLFPEPDRQARTGFSPNQSLRPSLFVRPSTRPVMRIEAERQPLPYLAGNRLNLLNSELEWIAAERPTSALTIIDAVELDNGDWRWTLPNHHVGSDRLPAQTINLYSLASDGYLFMPPDTDSVSGAFTTLSRSPADVVTPDYERGADRRWQIVTGGTPVADVNDPRNLLLPDFWDNSLQARADELAGDSQSQTVQNIINYFAPRPYSLQTNFDPDQPFHDFFLNDQAGYCFWFASASALALRANGIPSRLVGGYLVHEKISSNRWLVRERDAHSWVEWQDSEGLWHTIDPTPASIEAFFANYRSSALSHWYHNTAANWQALVDRILADELSANLVRWGGVAILLFLFVREYRRIRGQQASLSSHQLRWQKLWQRFLKLSKMQPEESWTLSRIEQELPADLSDAKRAGLVAFLRAYNESRFNPDGDRQLAELERQLDQLRAT